MSSLTYAGQHLAWQQRISKEAFSFYPEKSSRSPARTNRSSRVVERAKGKTTAPTGRNYRLDVNVSEGIRGKYHEFPKVSAQPSSNLVYFSRNKQRPMESEVSSQ